MVCITAPDRAAQSSTLRASSFCQFQLGVPEVWRFEHGTLQISVLDRGTDQEAKISVQFPNSPIA